MIMKSNPSTRLISAMDERKIIEKNMTIPVEVVEYALERFNANDVYMPDKISHVFDEETQNRVNCMPGALLSEQLYGVKWVAVFPNNPKDGYRNVTGTTILTEIQHGHTLAIMDSGYLTDIRTAAVGATAAKYLSRANVETIGFIGAGQQARRHLDLIKVIRPSIKKCYVSSKTLQTVNEFIEEESSKHPDVEFVRCGNDFRAATIDADIIVTATSTQSDLLKADWIKKGALYIHVAGWEDEYAVAQKATKIVCDDWECIKHRTQTISRMYKEGLLNDNDIYGNLVDIVNGTKAARENDEEFIYFCSVGLAYIDVAFAKYVYEQCTEQGLGTCFAFN